MNYYYKLWGIVLSTFKNTKVDRNEFVQLSLMFGTLIMYMNIFSFVLLIKTIEMFLLKQDTILEIHLLKLFDNDRFDGMFKIFVQLFILWVINYYFIFHKKLDEKLLLKYEKYNSKNKSIFIQYLVYSFIILIFIAIVSSILYRTWLLGLTIS